MITHRRLHPHFIPWSPTGGCTLMSSHDHPQEAAPSCHPMITHRRLHPHVIPWSEEMVPSFHSMIIQRRSLQGLHYILAGTAQSVERQVRILPLPAVLEVTLGSHSSGSLSIWMCKIGTWPMWRGHRLTLFCVVMYVSKLMAHTKVGWVLLPGIKL